MNIYDNLLIDGTVTINDLVGISNRNVIVDANGLLKSVPLVISPPTTLQIIAGDGLTGGGDLSMNRTITLGLPSDITLSSTSSSTSTTHTHKFEPGGTTDEYIRGDGTLATFPTTPTIYSPLGTATGNNTVLLDNTARRNFTNIANTFDLGFGTISGNPYVRLYSSGGVTVGSGLTFATSNFANLQTGNLTASRTFQFPNATGILPLRVNGVSADSLGDITIPIGAGGDINQNGNSFGVPIRIGTNDNYDLQFETNGSVRAAIGVTGNMVLGSSAVNVNTALAIRASFTGGTTASGIFNYATVLADVTNTASYNLTSVRTASTVNLAHLNHYSATQQNFSGATIVNQTAFIAQSSIIGATNNYGFRGQIPAGTNRWNIYMDGTASNYINGELNIGTTTNPLAAKLNVNGLIKGSDVSLANSHISKSFYNFTNGFLVKTNISSSVSTMFHLEIKGNCYSTDSPINTMMQGYCYGGGSILGRLSANNLGYKINTIEVFIYDSFLHFWIPQQSSSQSFSFVLSSGNQINPLITSVTNSIKPATGTTWDVTVTPKNPLELTDLTNFVQSTRQVIAGNGLTGGGNLSTDKTITLGTPSTITLATTNLVTTSTHSHNFAPGGSVSQYISGAGTLITFPTIPTVNDSTLTLSTSGIASGSQTFTANSSTNKTFTVNVPGTDIYANLTGTVLSILSSTGSGDTVNLSTITPSLQAVTTVGASTDKRIVHIDQGIEKQSTNAATAASNSSTLTIHRPIEYSNFLPITGIPYIKLPTDSIANSNAIVIKGRFRKWNALGTFWYATDFEITVQQTSNSLSITPVLLSNHSIDEHLPIRLIHNGSDVRVTFGDSQSITALQLIVFDYIGRDGAMPNAFGAGIMPNTTGYTIIERPSDAIVYTATEPWVNSKIISKNTTPDVQIIPNPTEGLAAAGVGQIIISHPSVPTNTILDFTIKVQVYAVGSPTSVGEIRVSLYRGGGTTFTAALTAYVTANNVSSFNNLKTLGNIRVGFNSVGHVTLIIGDVGYIWGGTNLIWSVEKVTASRSGSIMTPTGWESSFNNTALTGYTSLTNIPTELTYPTVSNLSGTYNSLTSPVPANTQVVLGTVTIIGASVNDVAYITQAASALIYKVRVTATNTVTVYVTNPTTSPIIQVAETLQIKIIK